MLLSSNIRQNIPMKIHVAPKEFSDWPQLLGLVRDAFAFMDDRIDPPSSLKKMGVAEFKAKAAAESLILAEDGGAIKGCAFAALREDCVYVGKVAVAPSARGKGVARAMFAAADALAQLHGRKFLELQTRIELVENHATFAALGFTKVGESAHAGYSRPTTITMRRAVDEHRGVL